MNIIVIIEGKEAIPVRAIPLLTDWQVLTPDTCAAIFSGDDSWEYFEGLNSYRLNPDGTYKAISERQWKNYFVRELRACSEKIKAAQVSQEVGYQQWRQSSLALLPAGAFVWREAFESAHKREFGPDSKRARMNGERFNLAAAALNFNPTTGPTENWHELVMEGFERLLTSAASHNLEQLSFVRAIYEADKNDAHWLGLSDITSHEAAVLLSGRDPLARKDIDAQCIALLERRLTDYQELHAPTRRSWRDWHGVAMHIGAEYEKGFDGWFANLERPATQGSAGSFCDAPTQPQAEKHVFHCPIYDRLEPRSEWRGGRLADTDLLKLEEAASMATKHAGEPVTIGDFLRAAGRGEITLRAIVHRAAKVRKHDGGVLFNKGESNQNIVPAGAIPTLPLTACEHLAATGRASWRTFDSFEAIDGTLMRYSQGMLTDDEPDFETVPDDCRVVGYDVRALADAFIDAECDEPQAYGPAPVVAESASDAPQKVRRDLLAPVIEAAQKECKDPSDAPAVWAVLVYMAEARKRPLLGVTDEGIKWNDAKDTPQFFTLKNLRDRLYRKRKQAR